MNVFPTFENYISQFRIFMEMVPEKGALIYCNEDPEVKKVAQDAKGKMLRLPYSIPDHRVKDGKTVLQTAEGEFPLMIFGNHNLMNLEGARLVCNQLNISNSDFYKAIGTFKGASNRLELIATKTGFNAYRDFAHAPSKLKATLEAVKEQFADRKLIACFELHTYSSLNKDFLDQYAGSMEKADVAVVYFSPHALALKKLPMLLPEDIKESFRKQGLLVFSDSEKFQEFLLDQEYTNTNLLLMSSGNYDGLNVKNFAEKL
jgi:UDP-N-acetylmuramate: L-alanyl-gamma-D-glutamyl-meso-diaminopimelate ligase